MKDSYFERQKVKDMLDKKKVKLGIAPIGWTNDDMPDLGKENTFQQCVSEMALAGFTGSEVGGKYPTDVETLKKALYDTTTQMKVGFLSLSKKSVF